MTKELIAEARALADGIAYDRLDIADMLTCLADALETQTGVRVDMSSAVGVEAQIATRVPVQGEPNDDREALARQLREDDDPVNTWEQATEEQREYWRGQARQQITSRAVVHDAATEELARIKPLFENYSREYPNECNKRVKAEVERDAATAAVERCRAAVEKHKHWNEDCGWDVPAIEVLAALDGAPEPEVKP